VQNEPDLSAAASAAGAIAPELDAEVRVEHSIGVIKRVFGFAKVRYRGFSKSTHRLLVTCALANLFMARRNLLHCQQG
jgi:IS5 family transposase